MSSELNAQIAQRLFQLPTKVLHCLRDPEYGGYYVCPWCCDEYKRDDEPHLFDWGRRFCRLSEGEQYPCWLPPGMNFSEPVPDFSTSIANTWKITDHARTLPWYRGCALGDAATQAGGWTCEVWGKVDGTVERLAHVIADTAPLAICRGFLTALEELKRGQS